MRISGWSSDVCSSDLGDGNVSRLNESSIAVYIDEVYLGDESALAGQMFDVERTEVLRGPQGTLFGRNTTGGLVHYISSRPTDEFGGYGNVLDRKSTRLKSSH